MLVTQVGRDTAAAMRSTPRPARLSPIMRRIAPPGSLPEVSATLLEHVLFEKPTADGLSGSAFSLIAKLAGTDPATGGPQQEYADGAEDEEAEDRAAHAGKARVRVP